MGGKARRGCDSNDQPARTVEEPARQRCQQEPWVQPRRVGREQAVERLTIVNDDGRVSLGFGQRSLAAIDLHGHGLLEPCFSNGEDVGWRVGLLVDRHGDGVVDGRRSHLASIQLLLLEARKGIASWLATAPDAGTWWVLSKAVVRDAD